MNDAGHQAQARCPICGQSTVQQWRPFCSQRCADVDLGRWMTGRYSVPTEETPDDSDRGD